MQIPINNSQNPLSNWLQQKWLINTSLFILAVAFFIGFVLVLNNLFKDKTPTSTNVISNLPTYNIKRQTAEKKDRPTFGNPDAKLVIVEFSDFQCPVCQAEFPIIREVINKYKDQVLFIYRQYPIINEGSPLVAQASLCAFEQAKFWPMHDRLFLNPKNDYTTDDLNTIAKQSGLNLTQYNNCLSTEKYKSMVTEDFQDGYDLEAPGTPTFFINGDKLSGLISKDNWEIIIEQSLKLLNN